MPGTYPRTARHDEENKHDRFATQTRLEALKNMHCDEVNIFPRCTYIHYLTGLDAYVAKSSFQKVTVLQILHCTEPEIIFPCSLLNIHHTEMISKIITSDINEVYILHVYDVPTRYESSLRKSMKFVFSPIKSRCYTGKT
jgi:hypothetical protein